jgi:predicted RNase H-like HicB family nuclease
MVLTAIIHKEDDWFVAECPEVGTASQGKSVEEALANLREATEVYLEEFPQQPTMHPILTTFEVSVHA